jgi:hypothetical protein
MQFFARQRDDEQYQKQKTNRTTGGSYEEKEKVS